MQKQKGVWCAIKPRICDCKNGHCTAEVEIKRDQKAAKKKK